MIMWLRMIMWLFPLPDPSKKNHLFQDGWGFSQIEGLFLRSVSKPPMHLMQ